MGDRWVINASPVILLAKAEVIQFLPGLCDELAVPSGVVKQVFTTNIVESFRVAIGSLFEIASIILSCFSRCQWTSNCQ